MEIEGFDALVLFEQIVEDLKIIVTKFPKVKLTVKGEVYSYDIYDRIKFKITYSDSVITINKSERFYHDYPLEYDEFVDLCDKFNIEDVIEEDVWNTMDDESDHGWYFIECKEAKINIEFTEQQVINF